MNFTSEWSWWFFPFFVIISFAISWYFVLYNKKNDKQRKWLKLTLFSLRFLSIFLLLVLLIGIFVNHKIINEEKPVLITLIDNSLSMTNDVNKDKLKKNIESFIEKTKQQYPQMDKKIFTIGEKFSKQNKLNFDEQSTDLSEGFEQIYQQYYKKNIGSIILISDGNYNSGLHPIYTTSKLPFVPIYTIGIGSDVDKKDQILKEINHNDIAFYKNKFNVQINVESFKCSGKSSKVKIIKNGKTIAEQKVQYSNNSSDFKQLNFELEANNIGFQRYDAVVETIDGEYTVKNNNLSFYIEVLESRNKILILSGAPHPDISVLKGVLSENENVSVEFKTIDTWDKNIEKVDLIIWHEPGVSFSENVNQKILLSKIPILYFIGIRTTQNVINKLKIGLEQSNQNQSEEYQAVFDNSFQLFDLSSECLQTIEKFPPLIGKYGKTSISKQNIIFLKQKLASISKNEPLCFFGENEFQKYGVILGEGIWRWKMNEFSSKNNYKYFSELFSTISQYLVRKSNSSQLRVQLPKRILSSDKMNIIAEFYNEALERSNKVEIGFNLIDSKGKKAELEFGLQNDQYLLELSKLSPGIYSWTAFTEYNGKKFNKSGSFVVEDLLLEKRDNKSNHSVLRDISEKSRAKFYKINDSDKLLKELSKRNDIKPVMYSLSKVDSLLDFIWIFLILIILLTSEWFLRRYYGVV